MFRLTHNAKETVIAVDGVFDGEAAAKLCALLVDARLPTPAVVVIDLGGALEVSCIALAALLEAKRKDSVEVQIRGLAHRHGRVLNLPADMR